MDLFAIFEAPVVIFGCGNVLFGDDGLAPRAVALLADEAAAAGRTDVAFVDAGTSIRTLLTDMALVGAKARRVVVVDVVQEPGRAPGSCVFEDLDAHHDGEPAGGFLHHAPTWGMLRRLRDTLGMEVAALTVQAERIPSHMDDRLSPAAEAALPRLLDMLRELAHLPQEPRPPKASPS